MDETSVLGEFHGEPGLCRRWKAVLVKNRQPAVIKRIAGQPQRSVNTLQELPPPVRQPSRMRPRSGAGVMPR
jgi:hypothetical protein